LGFWGVGGAGVGLGGSVVWSVNWVLAPCPLVPESPSPSRHYSTPKASNTFPGRRPNAP
jgi:hypothetical protein